MATDSAHRAVSIQRFTPGRFTVANDRGGRITTGTGGDTDFTPTELLLAAIGACTAIDVDTLTSRRAEPEDFQVQVGAEKVRDAAGNHLAGIAVTFRVVFPPGEGGDAARADHGRVRGGDGAGAAAGRGVRGERGGWAAA